MKHFFTCILMTLGIQSSHAQFVHLNQNEESESMVVLHYADESFETGFFKNNPSKNKALRALATGLNRNAMKTPELVVSSILFKPESNTAFQEVNIDRIDRVTFLGDTPLEYKKVKFFKVNLAKETVETDNTETMFFIDYKFPGFERYRNTVVTKENGRIALTTHYYYAKNYYTNEFYNLNHMALDLRGRMIGYFKLLGKGCDEFTNYLNKLDDKKSAESIELKAKMNEIEEELKNPSDPKLKDGTAIKQEKWYRFMSEKYKEFGCKGSENF